MRRWRLFASLVCTVVCAGWAPAGAATAACDLDATRPWINRWLDAWELVSREILKLPDAPAPNIVFYDTACVFTTSAPSRMR